MVFPLTAQRYNFGDFAVTNIKAHWPASRGKSSTVAVLGQSWFGTDGTERNASTLFAIENALARVHVSAFLYTSLKLFWTVLFDMASKPHRWCDICILLADRTGGKPSLTIGQDLHVRREESVVTGGIVSQSEPLAWGLGVETMRHDRVVMAVSESARDEWRGTFAGVLATLSDSAHRQRLTDLGNAVYRALTRRARGDVALRELLWQYLTEIAEDPEAVMDSC